MDKISLWEAISTRTRDYPELVDNLEVDVAIIGGGITGITAASHLFEAGKTVAIIEAEKIGGVTTSYSTGNLYVPVQPFYQNIVEKFDVDTARLVANSRNFAMDYIEKKIHEKNISCNFSRRPWYGYTADHARISLEKEVDLLKQLNVPIEYTQDIPFHLKYTKAVVIPNQARFNPLQYVISMAKDLADQGCLIYENSRVLEVKEDDKCIIKTNHGEIISKKVIIATHTPIGVSHTQMFTAPYRSYVVAARLRDYNYPEAHCWDLDRPPYSICTHATSGKNPDLILVSGSHHKTGQGEDTNAHYEELRRFLIENFSVKEVAYQWSAQHYKSADNIPYIGLANRGAKHMYIATGYFADGLIYGTLAGMLIGDTILNKENSLINTYQANRFTKGSIPFLKKENMNVLEHYLKDLPLCTRDDFADLKPGEGRIIERDQQKYGISRDENDKLHVVSAVCTHMKCIVNWNNAEKTWDCPCHGSRFTREGCVIEGPATKNLKQFKE